MKAVPFLFLSVMLAGCAQRAEEPQPDDASRPVVQQTDSAPSPAADPVVPAPATVQPVDSMRGTVVVTSMGPSSRATLSTGDGSPVMLEGALESELRQLAAARVTVFGTLSGEQRRTMAVQRYDVVAIDGERPTIGTVLAGDRLAAGGDTLTVVGQPEPLPIGAKVWIIGQRDGAQLRLQSWGIIRR